MLLYIEQYRKFLIIARIRHLVNVKAPHTCAHWSAPQQAKEPIHAVLIALRINLDSPVSQVPHMAENAALLRLPVSEVAKTDPLNEALNMYLGGYVGQSFLPRVPLATVPDLLSGFPRARARPYSAFNLPASIEAPSNISISSDTCHFVFSPNTLL